MLAYTIEGTVYRCTKQLIFYFKKQEILIPLEDKYYIIYRDDRLVSKLGS